MNNGPDSRAGSNVFRVGCSMGKKELLINEIEQIPEPFFDELLDYIQLLKSRIIKEKLSIAIASESSLKKDWLRPEEDEAWQDL